MCFMCFWLYVLINVINVSQSYCYRESIDVLRLQKKKKKKEMELKMEAFNGEWKFNHLGNL